MSVSKARKTYTLDPELVDYLEIVRQERNAESASSALEQILRESRRRRQMQQLNSSISDYYDALPPADRKADESWGEFSESQFPSE
jgi:hypothetical protein